MQEIKTRMEINREQKKYRRKINETKSSFLEKTKEMDKSLDRLPKEKKEDSTTKTTGRNSSQLHQ